MKEKLKPQVKLIYVIASVIFAFYALSSLYDAFNSARKAVMSVQYGFLHIIPFIYLIIKSLFSTLGNGGIALGIYKNKRNVIVAISYLCITVSFLMTVLYSIYSMHSNGIINHIGIMMYALTIITNILSIASVFIMLMMITASFTTYLPKMEKWVKKLWYVPAIIELVVIILTFALSFIMAHNDNNYIISIPLLVKQMLLYVDNIVSILLLGMWVSYVHDDTKLLPDEKEELESALLDFKNGENISNGESINW